MCTFVATVRALPLHLVRRANLLGRGWSTALGRPPCSHTADPSLARVHAGCRPPSKMRHASSLTSLNSSLVSEVSEVSEVSGPEFEPGSIDDLLVSVGMPHLSKEPTGSPDLPLPTHADQHRHRSEGPEDSRHGRKRRKGQPRRSKGPKQEPRGDG